MAALPCRNPQVQASPHRTVSCAAVELSRASPLARISTLYVPAGVAVPASGAAGKGLVFETDDFAPLQAITIDIKIRTPSNLARFHLPAALLEISASASGKHNP